MSLPEIIETERLRLRPIRVDDAGWIFRDYATDADVTRFLTWPPYTGIGPLREFLSHVVDLMNRSAHTTDVRAIERRHDDRGLGMIDLRIDPRNRRASLGYVLSAEHHGQGIMTEATRRLVEVALDPAHGDLHRVGAITDVENIASQRVLEKAGLRREGVLRRYLVAPNLGPEPRDVLSFARVRGDELPSTAMETSR